MQRVKFLLLTLIAGFLSISSLLAEDDGFFVKKLEDEKTKAIVFSTTQGDIPKGSSMSVVMGILGNPQGITSKNNSEIWLYHYGPGKSLVVYFTQGVVVEVKDRRALDK